MENRDLIGPVRKKHVRIDDDVRRRFLEELARTGQFACSAKASGASYAGILLVRRRDRDFEDQVDHALQLHRESLAAEAHRRGVDGIPKGVYYKGVRVETDEKVYSDRLLELLLKRHDPEFRDRVQVDTNVRGGVLVVGAAVKDVDEWVAKHNRKEVVDAQDGGVQPPGDAR